MAFLFHPRPTRRPPIVTATWTRVTTKRPSRDRHYLLLQNESSGQDIMDYRVAFAKSAPTSATAGFILSSLETFRWDYDRQPTLDCYVRHAGGGTKTFLTVQEGE